MGIETWLNWISIGLIVLWTIRLASAKGQNPWIWAVASVGLMAVPYFFSQPFLGLLGMAPMLYLLILKRNSKTTEAESASSGLRIECPKCKVSHLDSYQFCVNCGWDLSQNYAEDLNDDLELTSHDYSVESVADPSPNSGHVLIPSNPEYVEVSTSDTSQAIPVQPNGFGIDTKDFKIPKLTAASLTDRGSCLFAEGRFQEAVDQFTKAIAFDPRYKIAWAKRSEAHLQMGMTQKAEDDMRSFEGIGQTG